MIYLDTHVLAWLYAGQLERFPARARALLEDGEMGISPLVMLELQYLQKIERIRRPGRVVVDELAAVLGIEVVDRPLSALVPIALEMSWTMDPFDRLICAQALADAAPLLTADRTVHEHLERAVWD